MNIKLVKFQNDDGLYLDGLYYFAQMNKKTIIHVHGSFGNFYSNLFIDIMGRIYCESGYNFLTFNLTQHDGICEGVREVDGNKRWEYIGYCLSDYDSCVSDISGAVRFLQFNGITHITLQGHSMGCNRVLYYLNQKQVDYPVILLSPTNSLELQKRWVFPETIQNQVSRLKALKDTQAILYTEHGVRTETGGIDGYKDDAPFIPISAKSFVSIFENPSMDILALIKNAQNVPNYAFVYLGGQDDYQTENANDYVSAFDLYFKKTTYLQIPEGNHSFSGFESYVASKIIAWENNLEF